MGEKMVSTLNPPPIIPRTDNPAVRMGLKLMKQKMRQDEKKRKEREKKVKAASIWAIDFDGTLTQGGRFPGIGKPNTKLIELLKMAKLQGVRLILWTSREGDALDAAVKWCTEQGLEFDAVNDNIPEVTEMWGYNSRKVHANLFIDDRAFHFWGEEGEDRLCKLMQEL